MGQKIVLLEQCDSPGVVEFLMRCFSFRGQSIKVASFFKEARVVHCLTGPLDVLVHSSIAAMGIEQYTGKKPICDTHKVCQGERRTMTNIRNGMMTTQFSTKVLYLGGIRVANFRCLMRSKPMGNIFSSVTQLIKEKASQTYQLVL